MISQIPKANTYSLSVSIWPCSYSTDMCGWLLLFDGANLNMWLLLVPSDCCLCLSQHDFILTGGWFYFLSQQVVNIQALTKTKPAAAECLLIICSILPFVIPHLSFVWEVAELLHRLGCNLLSEAQHLFRIIYPAEKLLEKLSGKTELVSFKGAICKNLKVPPKILGAAYQQGSRQLLLLSAVS